MKYIEEEGLKSFRVEDKLPNLSFSSIPS